MLIQELIQENNNLFIISLIIIIIIGNIWAVIKGIRSRKHNVFYRKAKDIYKKINTIENDGAKLVYLKKINPYVFEELILYSLKQKGYKIKRNKKYSGDGGIDGVFWDGKQKYYIQAKRYKSHITKQHVIDFKEIIKKNKVKGLFVHTGKTGRESKKEFYEKDIDIISGNRLIKLFDKNNNFF